MMNPISNQLRTAGRFWRDCRGNIALTFALVLPILVGLAGLGIDSAAFYDQETRMQNAADAAALAIANELRLYREEPGTLEALGESRAETLLTEVGIGNRPHETEVQVHMDAGTAQVRISMVAKAFLPVDVWGENPIVVTSTAMTYGELKLCVLALKGKGGGAIKLERGASVTATDCAVHSNSTDQDGIKQ